MNKTAVKNFAVWARNKLIEEITYKAGLLGITENGIAPELPASTDTLKLYDIGTKEPVKVEGIAISQRVSLVNVINGKAATLKYKEAFEYVIDEVAYTWFNRLIAIRFMEVNDYLPSGVRVLSSENPNKNEPDMVTNPFDTDIQFTEKDRTIMATLKDNELFRFLFIKQCNTLNDILPELFEKTNNYTELLLTLSFTDTDSVVYHLVHDIPEADFNVAKEGQVQIIGWLYQYYNSEPKDKVFAALKKNVKISKENIPAATQLFTPDWIVRYMVENSLGRLWADGHADFDKSEWKYYLDEAEQEESVKAQLSAIREEYKSINPEEIKFCDPCMGSGHILVYAFDVLMQIYLSQGYSERDAAAKIIRNNLYGLDIDKRAYQLAYFAVKMKAVEYDSRFLRRDTTKHLEPNLSHFQGLDNVQEAVVGGALKQFAVQFKNCDTYGSLLEIKEVAGLDEAVDNFSVAIDLNIVQLEQMMRIYTVLSQKYDVVCTNPPYMGGSGMNATLADFVKKYYPDSKSDLFAVFIERCGQLAKSKGYYAMITQHAFMFLSSYEKLREKLLLKTTVNMAHLGARAFDEIGGEVVQTTAFVNCNTRIAEYKGTYARLVDINGENEKKELFLSGENRHTAKQENFSKIPGAPVAYWVSENFIRAFEKGALLGALIPVKKGLDTGENDKFLRYWHEVPLIKLGIGFTSSMSFTAHSKKWAPHDKGGEFRRWYGNIEWVINWENNGYELHNSKANLRSEKLYFTDAITWSSLSSGKVGFRFSNYGAISNTAGSSMYPCCNLLFYLGLTNTKLAQYIYDVITPTLNYSAGPISLLPVVMPENSLVSNIEKTANENVNISITDWNSFETSWDFKKHPLLNYAPHNSMPQAPINYTIAAAYDCWKTECQTRFNQLKANEEELNRIFIEIYGLQDELTPEVEDKDVTVRKADLQREIKSLISYAVGCMFGRYSLDVDGLVYAGGEWNVDKYTTFVADKDNCIPITDEEYFADDIVGRFADFIKIVYGEDTLEENLDFIADVLGTKGVTSRQKIRAYFLNDFIKDHIKTYQKRPIYWMFDSGKQDGFKALVYMHRWNADTIGNVRVEYLHKLQRVYESEIARMQDTIDNSTNSREITLAEKRKDKLTKQLKEAREYNEKVTHLALARIDIDLDDGVKVNYEKVQTAQDGKKLEILTPIK